jgi:hypothetical protein
MAWSTTFSIAAITAMPCSPTPPIARRKGEEKGTFYFFLALAAAAA